MPAGNPSSAPLRGMLLIVIGFGVLTANDGVAKWLTESYPVGQVLAVRGGVSMAMLLGLAMTTGTMRTLRVRNWPAQGLRALLMTASTICFVTGLSLLPIADAIAVTFVGPLLTVALAVPLLGERVDLRRWLAIAVGLGAVLLMLRPGTDALRLAAMLPLGAAVLGAFRDILTRAMHATETSQSVLLVSIAAITVYGFSSAFWGDWQPIPVADYGLFAVSGLLVGVAQYLLIEAFRYGEAGLIAPFKYTSMVWAVLIGFTVWGQVPDAYTSIGAALVILSGLYMWWRERGG